MSSARRRSRTTFSVLPELLTIGHSNHSPQHFGWLLDGAEVDVIADVRSWPHSRYAGWADRDRLAAWLRGHGRSYVFLGSELGGRPDGDEYYDAAGHVLYGRVARSASFRLGIERLQSGISEHRVAIMCTEEDPTNCHRRLLVTKVLMESGIAVSHVRGDGRIVSELGVGPGVVGLFDDEDIWWRSTRSASRRRRLSASSSG
jgi:uncharacterized protein (DUF488 family)